MRAVLPWVLRHLLPKQTNSISSPYQNELRINHTLLHSCVAFCSSGISAPINSILFVSLISTNQSYFFLITNYHQPSDIRQLIQRHTHQSTEQRVATILVLVSSFCVLCFCRSTAYHGTRYIPAVQSHPCGHFTTVSTKVNRRDATC
jgi:hypothetical protein